MSGPARARASWADWPDTSTLIRAQDLEVWDAGVYELKTRVYRVKDYGGSTGVAATDTQAVTDAIAAASAAGGGTVLFERGSTNKINSSVTLASNIHLYLEEGSVIDGTSMTGTFATMFRTLADTYTESSNSTNLSSNATAGDTTVSIAAGAEASFAVGDYIKVRSDANWCPDVGGTDTTLDGKIGEINIVKSKSSGSLTLWWPLMDSYATTDTATVGTISMMTNVRIMGTGTAIGRTDTSRDTFCDLDKVVGAYVGGVKLYNFFDSGVVFRDALRSIVDDIRVEGDGTSTSSSDYGVSFGFASQWCGVRGSTFSDCRHAATTNTSWTSRSGIPRFITYDNNWAYQTRSSCFDTHSVGEFITITNNHGHHPADSGVNARCPSVIVANNHFVKPGVHGVYLRNQSSRPSRYQVIGNYVKKPGFNGVLHRNPTEAALAGTSAGQTIYGSVMQGNIVEDPGSEGLMAFSDAAWQVKNVNITGNNVWYSAIGQSGIRIVNGTRCNVVSNIIDTATNGVKFDNSSDHCVAMGNQAPNCSNAISKGTGAGHITSTADAAGAYNQ